MDDRPIAHLKNDRPAQYRTPIALFPLQPRSLSFPILKAIALFPLQPRSPRSKTTDRSIAHLKNDRPAHPNPRSRNVCKAASHHQTTDRPIAHLKNDRSSQHRTPIALFPNCQQAIALLANPESDRPLSDENAIAFSSHSAIALQQQIAIAPPTLHDRPDPPDPRSPSKQPIARSLSSNTIAPITQTHDRKPSAK